MSVGVGLSTAPRPVWKRPGTSGAVGNHVVISQAAVLYCVAKTLSKTPGRV